jgi:hypothetical protein
MSPLLNGLVFPYSASNCLSCKELGVFQLFYIFLILSIVPEFLHNSCTLPGVKNRPALWKGRFSGIENLRAGASAYRFPGQGLLCRLPAAVETGEALYTGIYDPEEPRRFERAAERLKKELRGKRQEPLRNIDFRVILNMWLL